MTSLRVALVMLVLSAVAVAESGSADSDGPLPFPRLDAAPAVEPTPNPTPSPSPVPDASSEDDSADQALEASGDVSQGKVEHAIGESTAPSSDGSEPMAETPPPPDAAAVGSASLEEVVDLRLPDLGPGTAGKSEKLIEPSWLNEVIDDHRLLWQPVDSANDFVFRDGNGFGITSLGFKTDFVPDDAPIWTDLSFGWHFLSGPRRPDVPAQVYDLSLGIHVAKQLDPDWTIHFHLAPTLSTDWDNKWGDAFRLIGGALVGYQATPSVSGVLGFSWLDRPDLPMLPIAGVRWMVTEDVLADLIIPEPKIAYLLKADEQSSTWLYLKGEIGGGSWAIESTPDYDDRLGYRDARLLFGLETAEVDGDRHVLEFGYVFERQLHFDRRHRTVDLGATWSLRWGRTY